MKIPTKIRVGGQIYQVKSVNGLADSGSTDTKNNIVLLNNEMVTTEKESTLLHEIIEIINENNDLQLEHQTIQTLENCLYQVLKDNFNI